MTETGGVGAVAAPNAANRDEGDVGAAAELEVLFPDVDLEVDDPETGEKVALTLREFRFLEALEAQVVARPLIEALADAFGSEGGLDAAAIDAALGAHAGLWLELIGRACERRDDAANEGDRSVPRRVEAAWLAGLADRDGDALSDAMWSANGGFFTRRVVAEEAARKRRAERQSRSPTSSTPSSGPDTGGDIAT